MSRKPFSANVCSIFISGRQSLGLLAGFFFLISIFPAGADQDDDLSSTNESRRPLEELFKTDLVYAQEKGEWQLEVAPFYQNNSSGNLWTLPLSMEYGLTDNWQVEAEWDAFVQHVSGEHSSSCGIGDLEVGSQYSFMNLGGSSFDLAPRFSIGIPLGDVNKGLSEGFMEYTPAVILARDFPQFHHLQLFSEIGLGIVRRVKKPAVVAQAAPAADGLNFGAGFFVPVSQGTVTLEFNWNNNQWNHHGEDNEFYLTPGCTWKPLKGLEIGLGIPVGLNSGADRYDVIAHIIYEF